MATHDSRNPRPAGIPGFAILAARARQKILAFYGKYLA